MAGRTLPISGQIEPKSFPFLVADLHRNGATGSLKVEGPTYQKALYFRGGRVLFGSSNDPRDQLGAILIEEGRITPEQLEDVNSKVGPGNPLAKVLAETGFVSQRELSDAARAKVERILSDVIAYTSGTFEFEDGVLPKGAVDLKLSTERLILTAVRRITDRTFVLRHLDGLDVVLRPAADLAAVRTEVESDTGGLLPHLDGLSTLKDAAGRTRLDDFEAAKVACALLFLGAVERVGPGGAPAPMLDLAETAREAFGEEWKAPTPPPPPPPPRRRVGDDTIIAWGKIDPQAFAPAAEPAASPRAAPAAVALEPEPAPAPPAEAPREAPGLVIEPDAPAAPPQPEVPAVAVLERAPGPPPVERPAPQPPPAVVPPPAVQSPPVVPPRPEPAPTFAATRPERPVFEPPPPVVPPPASVTPPASEPPPPRITPARVWTPPSTTPAPAVRTSPSSARPSKDDMAAVDALLGSRTVEGPLAPLERAPEPRYTPPARSVRARRGGAPVWQKAALGAGFVAVTAVGFAGVWYLRQGRGSAGSTAAVPPSAPPVTAAAAPAATVPARVATPSSPPASLAPRPPATPVAARPPAASGAAAARDLLRQGRLGEAAEGFAAHLRGAPVSSASIQLLVACSPDTVQKAVAAVDAAELLILPVNFRGRDCFRMCWGLYGSSAAASAAVGTLPEYFIQGGASPRVMSRAELIQ